MKIFARNSVPQSSYPFAFQSQGDNPAPIVPASSSSGGGGFMKVLFGALKALRVIG